MPQRLSSYIGRGGEVLNRLLDLFRVLLAAHKDAIGTSCHHYILQAIYEDGMLEFVDDVGVLAMCAHHGIAYAVMLEFVSKGDPSAKVSLFTRERYD